MDVEIPESFMLGKSTAEVTQEVLAKPMRLETDNARQQLEQMVNKEMNIFPTLRKMLDETRQFVGTMCQGNTEALVEVERRMIAAALRKHNGNISRAARELGLTRRGLYLKLDRLEMTASA